MPRGPSGRIVIEIDPELKKRLHRALERDHLTLKDWFLRQALDYLESGPQLSLRFDEPGEGRTGR